MAPKNSTTSSDTGKPTQRFSQEIFDLNQRIDRSYFIPHVFRSRSLNPRSFILGPVCPNNDIALLTQYYPLRTEGEVMHQLSHLHWTNWEASKFHTCFRSWPAQKRMWADWVLRMSPYLDDIWERLGIARIIYLSTADINQDPPLIAAAASFWSPSCNALLLNCGFLSPTILDVIHLTGFYSTGVEVHPFMPRLKGDETFSLNFNASTGYQAFLSLFAKLSSKVEPTKIEIVAFYLYWLCSFVLCVPGVKPAKEYITLALYLFHQEKLALAPFLLGSLYRGINLFVSKRISNSTQGPMWLFQSWLKAYFPFSLGNYSAILPGKPISYAEFFLCHDHPNPSLPLYFRSFYKIDRNGALVDFNPFKDRTFSSPNLKSLLPPFPNAPGLPLKIFWSRMLVPRFLYAGTSSKTILEPYTPSQMARQFGLSQGLPMPFLHSTFREGLGDKFSLGPSQKNHLNRLSNEFENACNDFEFTLFDVFFDYDSAFGDWWDLVVPILFPSNIDDCCSRFLTKSKDDPVPIQNHLDLQGNYVEVSPASISMIPLMPIPPIPSPSKGKRKLTSEEVLEEEKALKRKKTEALPQIEKKLLSQSIRAGTANVENTRRLRRHKEKSPEIVQAISEPDDESDEVPLIRKRKLTSPSQDFDQAIPPTSPLKPLPLVEAVPLSQIPFEQEQAASEGHSNPPSYLLLEKDSTEPIEPLVHEPIIEPVVEVQKEESTSKLHEGNQSSAGSSYTRNQHQMQYPAAVDTQSPQATLPLSNKFPPYVQASPGISQDQHEQKIIEGNLLNEQGAGLTNSQSLFHGKEHHGTMSAYQRAHSSGVSQTSFQSGLYHGLEPVAKHISEETDVDTGLLMGHPHHVNLDSAHGGENQMASVSARDFEAFGRSLKPSNLHANYSGSSEIKHEVGSVSYPGTSIFVNPYAYMDVNIQSIKPFSLPLLQNTAEEMGRHSLSFTHTDHKVSDAAFHRTDHSQVNTQMSSSFNQNGDIRNGQMLSMYENTANNSKYPSPFGKLLEMKTLIVPLDVTGDSKATVNLSPPSTLPSNFGNTKLSIITSRKRKTATSDLLPWHTDVTESSNRLHGISVAEMEWAKAVNRLIDKVDYEVKMIKDVHPLVRPKKRLVCTTQLMQMVFRPAPEAIFRRKATFSYDSLVYFSAKIALGDACNLNSWSRNGSGLPCTSDNMKTEESKPSEKSFSTIVEALISRAKNLEADLLRLDKTVSVLDAIMECKELEKFSMINRFARFHFRGQPKVQETSTSTSSGSTSSLLTPSPYRYVQALRPRALPDKAQCLAL